MNNPLGVIGRTATERARVVTKSFLYSLTFFACLIPGAQANPTRFVALPLRNTTEQIEWDIWNKSSWAHSFVKDWARRGYLIRQGHDNLECLGNLSYALSMVGDLTTAEYGGAASALALLPTAGALIGAPIRDMWYIYKIVPLAGITTMFLSLGGNLIPQNLNEYEGNGELNFGGASSRRSKDRKQRHSSSFSSHSMSFAERVEARVDNRSGGSRYPQVWAGIISQVALVMGILATMWYAQLGSVVNWWCRAWGWMFFWYSLTILTSIFDSVTAAPFRSWTMRVSRAPAEIVLGRSMSRMHSFEGKSVLDQIEEGVNTDPRVFLEEGSATERSRTCFYVVISENTKGPGRVALQTVARCINVTVFAFGTALFASATLMSIIAASMVLTVTLACGILSRIIAMWMVAKITEHGDPIIHEIVDNREIAAQRLDELLAIKGLLVEMNGHVFFDGYCIARRSQWFSMSRYLGLLAKPYTVPGSPSHRRSKASPSTTFLLSNFRKHESPSMFASHGDTQYKPAATVARVDSLDPSEDV